ncbi:MAG TPA: hypothetical protein VFT66_14335 [Roseiflexaceae bacterium]|nr:hypothetical protein [Roseiflexaceae bacterium]
MSNSADATELDLVVGSLHTTTPEEDREQYEEEREWLSDIQDLLREEGVEADLLSNPGTEVWEGGIDRFMDLYELRILAAYLERGKDVSGVLDQVDMDGEPDPVLADIWEGTEATRFPHLINHQAEGGYYLPSDFPEPIWLEFDSDDADAAENIEEHVVSFGSSVALQRELVDLDRMLQSASIPTRSGPYRCLRVLRDAADQSVSTGLPIIIW